MKEIEKIDLFILNICSLYHKSEKELFSLIIFDYDTTIQNVRFL